MRISSRIVVILFGLLAMVCAEVALSQGIPTSAMPSASQNVPPDCAAADLDTTYQFKTQPPTERVIITFRNISDRPCILQSGQGVVFGDYRHGHNIWTKECRNCGPDGTPKIVAPIEVATGASAQLIVTWQTQAADGEEPCQQGGTVNGNAWDIWAVSLLGDVCSVVRVDSYVPGPTGNQNLSSQNGPTKQPVTITLTASDDKVYSLDSFLLHVAIEDRSGALELKEDSCPFLFVRTRGSDGSTSLQEMSGKCSIAPLAQQPGRSIRLDLGTLAWGALGAPVDHSVQVFAVLGSPHAQDVQMVASNTLNLRGLDPVTIPRTWGPEMKGLAISLFLDKNIYLLGEDIPLRMAVKNFSADANIASGELPCSAGFTFKVRDSNGQEVESGYMGPCSEHGWLIAYPKGTVLPVRGVTMNALGLLPKQIGKYTVEATWNAMSEKKTRLTTHLDFNLCLEPSLPLTRLFTHFQ